MCSTLFWGEQDAVSQLTPQAFREAAISRTVKIVHSPIELWQSFQHYFFSYVCALTPEERHGFWHVSLPQRTQGYEVAFPKVAESMGLSFKRELHNFDGAFLAPSEFGYPIPIVMIEWENNPNYAHHEVRKLLSMQVPLRVVISVVKWGLEQYPEANRDALLSQWNGTVSEHLRVLASYGVQPQGYLGFMIGECGTDGILRYYTFGRSLNSAKFDEERVVEVGNTKPPDEKGNSIPILKASS